MVVRFSSFQMYGGGQAFMNDFVGLIGVHFYKLEWVISNWDVPFRYGHPLSMGRAVSRFGVACRVSPCPLFP